MGEGYVGLGLCAASLPCGYIRRSACTVLSNHEAISEPCRQFVRHFDVDGASPRLDSALGES